MEVLDAYRTPCNPRVANLACDHEISLQEAPVNQPTWTGRSGVSGSANGAQTRRFGALPNARMAAQHSTAAEPNGSSAASEVCHNGLLEHVKMHHWTSAVHAMLSRRILS